MRVLVVVDEPSESEEQHAGEHAARGADAVAALRAAGIESVQEMAGAIGLLRRVADFQPDIILIDTASPSRDVLESLCVVNTFAPMPMLMFTPDDSDASIRAALAAGVTVYSVTGVDTGKLSSVLRIANARFQQQQQLTEQLASNAQKQQQQRAIDTAKGLIMARENLDEAAAYKRLRALAMNSRRSLAEIAEDLLRQPPA